MLFKQDILNEQQSSYRQIFKATSLFGGVQVLNIIISVIRFKVIAVLLGPSGIGIAGLLISTATFISSLTNFGLGTSSVKNVAAANESGNIAQVAAVVMVLRRLVWITGLLGMLLTLVLSSYLSQITFGDKSYTAAFAYISVTVLFNQLTIGQNVLLQGLRKLRRLAKANVIGSIIGLIVSLPLYYFYKFDGIVPALIFTSIITAGVAWYFSKSVELKKIKIEKREAVLQGKEMLQMGFMLSLSSLISVGASYLVRIYISNVGGVEQVGLYNAGFTIIGTYVGLVFTAMSTDYYPRLSSVAGDQLKAAMLINQQAEVSTLILSPIICIFLVFINWVIILLYSNKFIEVAGMIHWSALGMYFKAASWSIAFILLAKGHSKTFLFNELFFNLYSLLFSILGFKLFGLNGLGISFLLSYVLYFGQVYIIARTKYKFSFQRELYRIFLLQFFLGLLCFLIMRLLPLPWSYLIGSLVFVISIWFSFFEMDKRLELKSLLIKFKKRF